MFINNLPLEKTIPALERRLSKSRNLINMFKNQAPTDKRDKAWGILAVEHKIAMFEVETEFIKKPSLSLKCNRKRAELGSEKIYLI
ncbi:hypothetical protein [Peribacillus sp. NPDC096540]|uniref:hypothetical protein n=1 Tax=Peribacillus sp. NPDC096540 TaxID=3390612 RepID=UPI003D032F82